MTTIEIKVLGPIRLEIDGCDVPLPRRQVRALLALLALNPQRGATMDRIVAALWERSMPQNPTHAVHVYVNRLRSLHSEMGDAVTTLPDGYGFVPDRVQTDMARFEWLAMEARRAVSVTPARTAQLADEAMALWRGHAFGGLHYAEFASDTVDRLEDLRLTLWEVACEADIELGRAYRALPELRQLAADHPFRDKITQLLVAALRADGRGTEAMVVERNHHRWLSEQFGLDTTHEAPFVVGDVPLFASA